MAGDYFNVGMAFQADTKKAEKSIQDLQKQLDKVMSAAQKGRKTNDVFSGMSEDMLKATKSAAELQVALEKATNVKTGKFDLGNFQRSLAQSKKTLTDFYNDLKNVSPEGQKAFSGLASEILRAEKPIKETSELMKKMKHTFEETARWQFSNQMVRNFVGAIEGAYNYAQDLNESLNNIRIVTSKSIDDMAAFAAEANNAAKALSSTTTAYTDASLIYFQQGRLQIFKLA